MRVFLCAFLCWCLGSKSAYSFTVPGQRLPLSSKGYVLKEILPNKIVPCANNQGSRTKIALFAENGDNIELSEPEQTVFDLLKSMHESQLRFRIVVIGNGAILETTSAVGPKFNLSQSPQTGDILLTMAELDSSFEFHVKLNQVSKIVLTEKEGPGGKAIRIFRFLTADGNPMSSLILSDPSSEAGKWYELMVEKYGCEIQL